MRRVKSLVSFSQSQEEPRQSDGAVLTQAVLLLSAHAAPHKCDDAVMETRQSLMKVSFMSDCPQRCGRVSDLDLNSSQRRKRSQL